MGLVVVLVVEEVVTSCCCGGGVGMVDPMLTVDGGTTHGTKANETNVSMANFIVLSMNNLSFYLYSYSMVCTIRYVLW